MVRTAARKFCFTGKQTLLNLVGDKGLIRFGKSYVHNSPGVFISGCHAARSRSIQVDSATTRGMTHHFVFQRPFNFFAVFNSSLSKFRRVVRGFSD
jgi:hypothetical protein